MPIEIKTEKVVKGNRESRLVKGVKALGRSRLPDHYLMTYPHCFMGNNAIIVKHTPVLPTNPATAIIKAGEVYSEDEFQRILDLVKRCGNRLMEINKELARLEAEWNGKETFEI